MATTSDDEKAVDSAYGTHHGDQPPPEVASKFRPRATSLPFVDLPKIMVGGRTIDDLGTSPRSSRRHRLSTSEVPDDGSVADDDADSNHERHIPRRIRHRNIHQTHSFGASSNVKYYKGRGSLKQGGTKSKLRVNWDSNVTSPNEEGSEDDSTAMKARGSGKSKKKPRDNRKKGNREHQVVA
jgi:hypothetical protein